MWDRVRGVGGEGDEEDWNMVGRGGRGELVEWKEKEKRRDWVGETRREVL